MKYLLLFLSLFMFGCAADIRAQAGANARAGIEAATLTNQAGDTGKTDSILKAAVSYLPEATGVPSSEWPQPSLSAKLIADNPIVYAESAPKEPLAGWQWAGIGLAALALLRIAGPLVPGVGPFIKLAGPFIKLAADATWSAMSTQAQKKADEATTALANVAQGIAPLILEIQRAQPETLPASVVRALERSDVALALSTFEPSRSPS